MPKTLPCSSHLDILGSRKAEIRLQLNPVRHLGHQRFRKTHRVETFVILQHGRKREPARIRGVVIRTVVVHRPVHELEIRVRPIGVQIEEICHAEFPRAELQPPLWQFPEQRQWVALRHHLLPAERNNLVPHEPRNVRSFAECGVSDHIQVEESSYAQRPAQSRSPRLLHIAQELRRVGGTPAGEER